MSPALSSLNKYLLLYLVFMASWIVTSTVLKYQLYGPTMLGWYRCNHQYPLKSCIFPERILITTFTDIHSKRVDMVTMATSQDVMKFEF